MVLELRGVSKRYGATTVLRGIDLSIPRGSWVVITGRSGSGKSTLFKLIAGLDRATEGDIRVEGRSLSALDDTDLSRLRLERLGLVFQSYNLLPDLSVLQNVRLPQDLRGVPRTRGEERAYELLRRLGLASEAKKRPHQLSGGQAQRVAIARALANDPALLLADEPTGSLDRLNAEAVIQAFREIHETLGTTVLIVTHDPLVIEQAPSRILIDEGRARWWREPDRAAEGVA